MGKMDYFSLVNFDYVAHPVDDPEQILGPGHAYRILRKVKCRVNVVVNIG